MQTVTQADIAIRAYLIWEAAGRGHGHDKQHWAQAERELTYVPFAKRPQAFLGAASLPPTGSARPALHPPGAYQMHTPVSGNVLGLPAEPALSEPFANPIVYCDGLASAEITPAGIVRLTFFAEQRNAFDGQIERVVVSRLVMPKDALHVLIGCLSVTHEGKPLLAVAGSFGRPDRRQ